MLKCGVEEALGPCWPVQLTLVGIEEVVVRAEGDLHPVVGPLVGADRCVPAGDIIQEHPPSPDVQSQTLGNGDAFLLMSAPIRITAACLQK